MGVIDLFGHYGHDLTAETKHNEVYNELKKHPFGCFFDVLKIELVVRIDIRHLPIVIYVFDSESEEFCNRYNFDFIEFLFCGKVDSI